MEGWFMPKMVDVDEKVVQQVPQVPEKKATTNEANYYKIEGLPSGGKFYPEGTEIYGRPLKVLEVKQLSSINEENADNIINSVLKKAIRGISVDEILIADKLYIMFWLRSNTYRESGYMMKYNCGTCKQDAQNEFLLEHLAIKNIHADFTMDKLTFELRGNKDKLSFAFPTIREERVADEFKANASYITNIDEDIVGLCVLIKTINGEKTSMLEKYNYIVNLDPMDYAYLISYVSKWSFGINPFVNVICEHCGGASVMGVSFQSDFWIPEISIG